MLSSNVLVKNDEFVIIVCCTKQKKAIVFRSDLTLFRLKDLDHNVMIV